VTETTRRLLDDLQASKPEVRIGLSRAGVTGVQKAVRIGRGAQVAAQSGVSKSVAAGATVFGYPAMPISLFKRLHALFQRLPQIWDRTKELEQRVERLENQVGSRPAEKERVG